jgi:superfamily I DNA and/or RNA helicase
MGAWAVEVSKAINEGKWLSVQYLNKESETTYFWCAIKDIFPDRRLLTVDIFNLERGSKVLNDHLIYYDNIQKASVIEGTTYDKPVQLIEKIKSDYEKFSFLEFQAINDRVLSYYLDCYSSDNEPYEQEFALIPGVALHSFKDRKYRIPDEDFPKVISTLKTSLKFKEKSAGIKFERYILNYFGIYSKSKGLIPIVYYDVAFDIEDKSFVRSEQYEFANRVVNINEKNKFFINNYLDCDYQYFIENFKNDESFYIDQIANNLQAGEKVDQMPFFLKLKAFIPISIRDEYENISRRYENGTLNTPLKSFFGIVENERNRRKLKPIIVYDKKINVNQLRVVHSALNRDLLFVQGPPGTGKTVSILNILFSCLLNKQTVLVVSNNNEAIDNIIRKMKTITYKNTEIRFPIVRLGSNDVMNVAFKQMVDNYHYFKSSSLDEDFYVKYELLENKLKSDMSGVAELVQKYENQNEQFTKIDSLKAIIETIRLNENVDLTTRSMNIIAIEAEIEKIQKTIEYPLIKEDELSNITIDEGSIYEFLKLNSVMQGMNIFKTVNTELRDLVSVSTKSEIESAFEGFKSFLRTAEGIKQLINCYPLVFSTNISVSKLGDKNTVFDLMVMEEASQCNPAISLIPMSRCHKAIFIGDQNQLRPVVTISDSKNLMFKESYSIPDSYDYKQNSILTVLLKTDSVSKFILLKKHYRCAKKIIDFSNKKYYDNELEIETNYPDENALKLIDIRDSSSSEKNTSLNEAKRVIEEIESTENKSDIAVITPFKNQAKLLRYHLDSSGYADIKVGTIHTFQGDEREKIIISCAITPQTTQGAYDWMKNNRELINVMTTRPKLSLVVITDIERSIQLSKSEMNDYVELLTYMQHKGDSEVTYIEDEVFTARVKGFKYYNSEAEKEFLQTISQIKSTNQQFTIATKVKVTDILVMDKSDYALFNYGNSSHFDFVIFDYLKKPLLAIEVMGPEHFSDEKVKARDNMKRKICEKHDLKLLEIKNDYVRRYNDIRSAIITLLKS